MLKNELVFARIAGQFVCVLEGANLYAQQAIKKENPPLAQEMNGLNIKKIFVKNAVLFQLINVN